MDMELADMDLEDTEESESPEYPTAGGSVPRQSRQASKEQETEDDSQPYFDFDKNKWISPNDPAEEVCNSNKQASAHFIFRLAEQARMPPCPHRLQAFAEVAQVSLA